MRKMYLGILALIVVPIVFWLFQKSEATLVSPGGDTVEVLEAIVTKRFSPEGFTSLTPEAPLANFSFFPPSKIDKRTHDALDDQMKVPTRAEFYFLSSDKTTLISLKVIFVPWLKERQILYLSVVSPSQNWALEEEYHELNRPYIQETAWSIDETLVIMTAMLVNPENAGADPSERTVTLNRHFNTFFASLDPLLASVLSE